MINFQQIFLVILISTLTVLCVIFSIFVFRILQELRQTLKKVNKMLDDMGAITGAISKPIVGLSEIATGFKSGLKIFEVIGRVAGKKHADSADEAEEDEDDE